MTDHERASDWTHIDCPCTTFEQGEDCPVGFPSLLCSVCDGKGVATVDDVVALAAEMLKVAEQVDELADPFAAWETIDLLKTQNDHLDEMREAMLPFRSGGDWGKIKAWVVSGAPNTDDARASMKWLTSCQVAIDKALSSESLPKLPECIRNGDLEAWIFSHPDRDESMEKARLELYAFRASLSPSSAEEIKRKHEETTLKLRKGGIVL